MSNKDIKASVQSQFGQNAENYVNSKIHAKGKDLAKLLDIVDTNGNEIVLDIATGGGHTANAFAPLCKKIIAFDLTTEILQVAKSFIEGNGFTNVEYVQGDAEQLPFQDESFDIITCRIAAHHFPNIKSFVKETFRTLKKGGTFLFIDNTAPERDEFDQFYNFIEKERDYSHNRAYKKSEWISVLEEHGFEIEEFYRFPKKFIFEKWCKNMNLSDKKMKELQKIFIESNGEIQEKFQVKMKENELYSFTGESVLMKLRKTK